MSSNGSTRLLVAIGIGIVVGALVGGLFPGLGRAVELLGEIFLNLLMMIVVPLVVLSMITGVTALGDVRKLGSIGWKTLAYYAMTTAISVSLGLVMVNLLKPGRGISPGESHPAWSYSVESAERRVLLSDSTWQRSSYTDKYEVVLLDQDIVGRIVEMSDSSVSVDLWEHPGGDPYYVVAEDGTRIPFRREGAELVSREPAPDSAGTGVEIRLPVDPDLAERAAGGLAGTLRQILVGAEEGGSQGLIPRNVFAAMANVDILPLIVFSLLIAAALSVAGAPARPAVEAIQGLNEAVMRLVHWIMLLAPVGIFGLIAARVGNAGGFTGFLPELVALGRYVLTVLMGLAAHGLLVLPLILRLVTGRNPALYARGVGAALINAFSTSSSSATLPLTIQGVEENNGVSNRAAGFVLPLGATINMDGTALYEAVAALFIAQVYGIELGPAMQAVIFLTATLAAIGAAGIPEAGLVTMVIVLRSVGLPLEGVGLILAIDWFLDRCRTTVNVWGDSVGAAVIESLETSVSGAPEPAESAG